MMLAEGELAEGVVPQADDGQIETANYTGPKYVVYNGTTPLQQGSIYSDSDVFIKNFTDFPNSETRLLELRSGDSLFYSIDANKWQVWIVEADGSMKISKSDHVLEDATGIIGYPDFNDPPLLTAYGPLILAPTWSAKEYHIPITSGSQSGTTLTFTAENYNTIQLPAAEEGYCWTFKYGGKEYDLNANEASKVWTNEINGIRMSGRDFNAANAELKFTALQPGNAEFTQIGWKAGEEKPAANVSSTTNGTGNIIYYYKVKETDDRTYTTKVPVAPGEYTAKAVFAAKGRYMAVEKTSDFAIAPADSIEAGGTKNLKMSVQYKLGIGQWTVAGDPTEYTGGVSFYVHTAGDYNFTKK